MTDNEILRLVEVTPGRSRESIAYQAVGERGNREFYEWILAKEALRSRIYRLERMGLLFVECPRWAQPDTLRLTQKGRAALA